jgi:hypothetical protein
MRAYACPFCGSDDQTGWSPNTIYDDIDLPGWGEDFKPLGFKDTVLYRDLKWILSACLLVSFLAISIRFY